MTKIYFAGVNSRTHLKMLLKEGVKNILLSYYYIKNLDLKIIDYKTTNIFLDSGGFTARVQDKEIDVYKYCDFLHKHPQIKIYANLDTNKPAQTLENQKIMEGQGLKPLPVYHYTEMISKDWSYLLEEYCKKYSYVAIGGLKPTTKEATINKKENQKRYINYCINMTKRYKVKLHGFGLTNPNVIYMNNIYSVDSKSWLSGEIYGDVFYFFERGKLKTKNLKKKSQKGTKDYYKITRWNLLQWKKYANYLEVRDE